MRIRPIASLFNLVMVLMSVVLFSCEIKDDGATDNPSGSHVNQSFNFENILINNTRFKVDIMPKDKQQEYIVFSAEKNYFLEKDIDTSEELLEDDNNYFSALASNQSLSTYDFLTEAGIVAKGDKIGFGLMDLFPDTEYVLYCYGVEFSGEKFEATTPIDYVVIKTTTPELSDVKFEIKSTIKDNAVSIAVNPIDYKGMYYSCIVPEGADFYIDKNMEVTEEIIRHYRNKAYTEFLNNDLQPTQFYHSGKVTIERSLEPKTNYQIVLFAVSNDQIPILSSTPMPLYFTTEGVTMSDLKLDIKISDIRAYSAEMTITPSNDTEQYACIHLKREQVPYAESNYDLMLSIIEGYQPAVFTGVFSETLKPLMPNVEYTVMAFGIEGNKPTTELFRVDYTSDSSATGKVNIESIELLKLFDADEIIALDSSYKRVLGECECVAIVEAKTNIPCNTLYFWWYEEWMKVGYNEEAFLEDLLLYPYANNPEIMDMYYSMDSEDLFFFAGVAEDENGDLGAIYYGDGFLTDYSMVSPAEEFFAYVENVTPSTNMVMVLGR